MPDFLKEKQENKNKSIPVYNGDLTPLEPVRPGKARILLGRKKAKIISTNPLALRLNYVKKLGANK
jgi:hypothetical protein